MEQFNTSARVMMTQPSCLFRKGQPTIYQGSWYVYKKHENVGGTTRVFWQTWMDVIYDFVATVRPMVSAFVFSAENDKPNERCQDRTSLWQRISCRRHRYIA